MRIWTPLYTTYIDHYIIFWLVIEGQILFIVPLAKSDQARCNGASETMEGNHNASDESVDGDSSQGSSSGLIMGFILNKIESGYGTSMPNVEIVEYCHQLF